MCSENRYFWWNEQLHVVRDMGGYNRCFIRYMCVTGAKQVAGGKAYKFGEHFITESSISIMKLTLCSRICWQDLLWHSTSRGFRRNRGSSRMYP